MKAVVVETNVIAVANEQAEQAGSNCVLSCIDALEKTRLSRMVVIDSGGRCFEEYFRYASRSGQPGVGDYFAKWLWERQAYRKHCERVDITSTVDDPEQFVEFPSDSDLARFDRSDRKFVAIARASRNNPVILNAADTDWWHHKEPLQRNGIKLQFLCPELMSDAR